MQIAKQLCGTRQEKSRGAASGFTVCTSQGGAWSPGHRVCATCLQDTVALHVLRPAWAIAICSSTARVCVFPSQASLDRLDRPAPADGCARRTRSSSAQHPHPTSTVPGRAASLPYWSDLTGASAPVIGPSVQPLTASRPGPLAMILCTRHGAKHGRAGELHVTPR
jgi:hypothetical protein